MPNLPLTNGAQVKTGSCNAAPMGVIAATTNMPSAKFQNPANLDDLQPNTDFNIDMAIINVSCSNWRVRIGYSGLWLLSPAPPRLRLVAARSWQLCQCGVQLLLCPSNRQRER